MPKIKIGQRWVGEEEPCLIIAEAGSNHNQSLEQAFRLIDVAVEAQADAVKFQLFRAKTMYPRVNRPVKYLKKLGMIKPIYDLIEDMEMPFEWIPKLAAYCAKRKIIFMATPFDEECADRLDPYVPAFKIASYEMTHLPFIQHVARKGKPLIVSTGAGNSQEIAAMIQTVKESKNSQLCLMQCTAKYPAPLESLNLKVIPALKKTWKVPVGFSDHSREPVTAPIAAIGLGANLLEKHFTLCNRLPGPDHAFAVEPYELIAMVRQVREAERALGHRNKNPHRLEAELREYRRGVFTLGAVPRGQLFSKDNVAVLRRAGLKATDITPGDFAGILGKRAKRMLPAYAMVSSRDVEG